MKKALFVATIATHIKVFHEPYLKLLHDNGYKTYVATKNNLKENTKIDYCDKFYELPIERSPYKLSNLKAIKELKRIIEEEKFDLIHCHTPMGAVVTRLAARSARKKYGTRVIYTAHGFHFYQGAPKLNWILFYPIEKWLAKYTDTLITINTEDYEFAKKKFSKRCHDINYIPGVGININKFDIKINENEKMKIKESFGLKKDDYVLTCVARLDQNKNQGFLINVMEQLVKEHNNMHLLLVGPDELNGYYQAIAKEKNLENNVHFLGRRTDINNILGITNIILSASLREGLPVNIQEAFAAGLPVVALNCRGMKDLVQDGVNGYIINIDSEKKIDEFTNRIIKIYNLNSKEVKEFKDNNLKKIKDYDVESLKEKYREIYCLDKLKKE